MYEPYMYCLTRPLSHRARAPPWVQSQDEKEVPDMIRRNASEIPSWADRAPLGRMFWLYGAAVSGILIAFFLIALGIGSLVGQEIALLLFGGYTAWVLVPIWRRAKSAPLPWRDVTRWLVIAWGANAALVCGFLQADLLTHTMHLA